MVELSEQVKIIQITGPMNIVSVIGADTYFGTHMMKHLASANQQAEKSINGKLKLCFLCKPSAIFQMNI